MKEQDRYEKEEIHSKVLRAGRRTYFFDVRATKADDYYLTITESKKYTDDRGNATYKKHKIYLYKEDFEGFTDILGGITNFIVNAKGSEVISETHQSDFKKTYDSEELEKQEAEEGQEPLKSNVFTDVSFDDI